MFNSGAFERRVSRHSERISGSTRKQASGWSHPKILIRCTCAQPVSCIVESSAPRGTLRAEPSIRRTGARTARPAWIVDGQDAQVSQTRQKRNDRSSAFSASCPKREVSTGASTSEAHTVEWLRPTSSNDRKPGRQATTKDSKSAECSRQKQLRCMSGATSLVQSGLRCDRMREFAARRCWQLE